MNNIAGLLSGVLLMLAVQSAPAGTPRDTLVMAHAIDDIITLDPAEIFEFSGAEYAGNTYDRLIGYDVNDVAKLFGVVAESWTLSADGKAYTFKIRPGIVFASGNPLTAEDAAFSLQRAILLNKSPAFILGQFGFGRAHHRVLHFVGRDPGMTVQQLLDILRITKQSLGRVLKELIDKGYVFQKEGESDRRQRLLYLTQAGEELRQRLMGPQVERIRRACIAGESSLEYSPPWG